MKLAIILIIAFLVTPEGSVGKDTYRLVSSVTQNEKKTVKRVIKRDPSPFCDLSFSWDTPDSCILSPSLATLSLRAPAKQSPDLGVIASEAKQSLASLSITGTGVTPVQADIEMIGEKSVRVADSDAIKLSFKVNGSISTPEADIRSITIDGTGTAIINEGSKIPLAGKLTLSRKVEFSPWIRDPDPDNLSGSLNMAWTVIP